MTDIKSPTYAEVVRALSKSALAVRELHGPGHVAVVLPAGRIVAMAFSERGANVLWSNPQLTDTDLVKNHPDQLVGGFGGDRLWFAPEVDYHWNGAPQWDTFSNYHVPAEADPGAYRFVGTSREAVELRMSGQLSHRGTGQHLGFEVQRTVRMTPPPLPVTDSTMGGIDYVGIKMSHILKLNSATNVGCVDLWHLLQMPIGSVLVVPLKRTAASDVRTPLSYGRSGGWVKKSDHILWRYTGDALAKFGLPATASTGRAAVLRELEPNRWCLIVRQFPVDEQGTYADHPYGVPRTDQVFQAWDGFGFGEMEYHSPVLDAHRGPRELEESDYLWAFGGSSPAIQMLLSRLLKIDVLELHWSNMTPVP